jgi:hypothetical protein
MRALPVVLAALVFPATASAAHFDTAPPINNATGDPLTFTIHADGQSASSGTAYKLSTETAWHRCLPYTTTVTITPPAGDYSIDVADDTSRQWFDEHQPASTTPECSQTTAPFAHALTTNWFYVRDRPKVEPPPKPPVDTCGPILARVGRLHGLAELAQARYEHRRSAARRRAWRRARSAYAKARAGFDKRC